MKILFLLASMLVLAHSQFQQHSMPFSSGPQSMFSTRNGLPFQSSQKSFFQQQQPMSQPFQQQPMSQPFQQQQTFQPSSMIAQAIQQPMNNMPQGMLAQTQFVGAMPQGPAPLQQTQFGGNMPQGKFVAVGAATGPAPPQQTQFAGAVPQGKFATGPLPANQFAAGQQHAQGKIAVAVSVQQPQGVPSPVQQPSQFENVGPQGKMGGAPVGPNQFVGQPTQFEQGKIAVAAGPMPPAQFGGAQSKMMGPPSQFENAVPVQQAQQFNSVPGGPVAGSKNIKIAAPLAVPASPETEFSGVSQAQVVKVEAQPALPPRPVQAQAKVSVGPIQQQQQQKQQQQQQQFSSVASRRPVNRINGVNVPDIPRFCSFRGTIECDPNFPYRTLNGSCNNLNNLWWGKAETPYKRYLEADYGDRINEPRLSVDGNELPNPYDISCTLHRESHEIEPFVAHIFMQWGQIVSHDVSSLSLTTDDERNISVCETCTRTQKCLPMPITQNVTCACINQMRHQCLEFVRSSAAFGDLACQDVRREQLNLQTSYLDASIVYGILESDIVPLMEARGRFRLQRGRGILLPDMTEDPSDCMDFTDDRRCFLAGDNRVNQNPGLQLLQTVLVREHNRVAEILASINPKWNDRTVFEEARRVVIAEVQHITYNEYLPILLGETVVQQMGLMPLQGIQQANVYDPTVDPRTANEFAAGAGRFGHSMIRSIYSRADSNYNTIGTFMLRNQFFRSHMFYDDDTNGGLESVARGFLKDPSMKVDQWFTEDVSRHLFETMDEFGRPFHFDLVSLNIQRGREHGLPSYVKFRDLCRLNPVRSWDDMRKFIPSQVVDIFMSLYRFVEDVDFYSAGLAEFKQNGGLLGPTFTCIVAKQFHDLKFGDRFWYETNQTPAAFTPAQLGEIRKMTLARMLCRNLKNTPRIQPRAMLSSKLKENNLVNCADLPDINWNLWRV